MNATRKKTEELREFILDNVDAFPGNIIKISADHFGVTRQAIHHHIRRLKDHGEIFVVGDSPRSKRYYLVPRSQEIFRFVLSSGLEEDVVWRRRVLPLLKGLKDNLVAICAHGVTEMLNNVIDHSHSEEVEVTVTYSRKKVFIKISDFGIGIFKKIHQELPGVEDERHAILELAKGKITTDPARHTGEGIFFTARMFGEFSISSGHLFFTRFGEDDWLIENRELDTPGTSVTLQISTNSNTDIERVFSEFASEHADYGFTRTHVPVKLAIYEGESLVSRSQAKRLLVRFERFKEVMLDFDGVDSIGQAFADEIFRVFALQHPEIELVQINANPTVKKMIQRALTHDGQLNLPIQ